MTVKKMLITSYALIIIGTLMLGIISHLMRQTDDALTESEEQRYQSYLLADQLRQSSDDLTRLARTYVVTGNPQYEKNALKCKWTII